MEGNPSGSHGVPRVDTAYVKDEMDLSPLEPDPAKPIWYQWNHWRKTGNKDQALVKKFTPRQPRAAGCVNGWLSLQSL